MPSRMDLYHRSDNEPQATPSQSRRSRRQPPVADSQQSVDRLSRRPLSRERLREEQLPPASKLKKIPPILKPSALLAIALLSVGLMGTLGHKSYSVHSNVVQTEKQHDHNTAIDTSDISTDEHEHRKSSSAKKHSKSSSERDSSTDDQTDDDMTDQQAQDTDTDVSAVGDDGTQQDTNQRRASQSQTQTYNRQSSHHRQSSQTNDNQSTYQTGGNTQQTQTNQAPAAADNQATYTVPNTGGDVQ